MIEIRHKGNYDVAELDGRSVAECREQYKTRFGISDKAKCRVNNQKIDSSKESEFILSNNDEIRFIEERSGKGAFMLGALLLALALTGATFARGYVTQSMSFGVGNTGGDFASITANGTGVPSWTAFGLFKGTTGSGNLFDVSTNSTGYSGDLTLTVSLANADQLVKAYRFLGLVVEVLYSNNSSPADINSDNIINSQDFSLLTLDNGAVNLYLRQLSGPANYTVHLKSGFYVSNIWGTGWSGNENPMLFAEVAQR